ncbi:penicillin-binding transpeptidase domain-containing protein [Adlercreutzia caecimuris]|jgi:cell division protein FtsI/penicillin-binding protein 2|nr:penicillin-binding transpeptidase domain-containing protein [Adlercreutzia caecimuris]MCI9208103.1 hypothetical protein [Adlercreutzia caecimuris]MCR2036580.1 penicillin-binding transpeptidase domain-containing protein [Adlercreutzia caecimuris]
MINQRKWSAACIAFIATAVVVILVSGCSATTKERGPITTADGVVLAMSDGGFTSQPRLYPEGPLAAWVIGSVYDTEKDIGIEQRFDRQLAEGDSICLTIDSAMQRAAEETLSGINGALVAIDPQTGAIRALAVNPSFDPANPTYSQRERGNGDDELGNAAATLHIPGSTFKTITLAAALEDGASLEDTVNGPGALLLDGGRISNAGGQSYGSISLLDAYAQSINTAFAELSLELGPDRVADMARNFGFDKSLPQDFTCEVSTVGADNARSEFEKAWFGVGQSFVKEDGSWTGPMATVVQEALVPACIANGGTLYAPYIVEKIEGCERDAIQTKPLIINERFLSQTTIDSLREAMAEVVLSGTGQNTQVIGVKVYGKTGTAAVTNATENGWFAGWAEADGKSLAFAVFIYGSASDVASERASAFVRATLKEERLG